MSAITLARRSSRRGRFGKAELQFDVGRVGGGNCVEDKEKALERLTKPLAISRMRLLYSTGYELQLRVQKSTRGAGPRGVAGCHLPPTSS